MKRAHNLEMEMMGVFKNAHVHTIKIAQLPRGKPMLVFIYHNSQERVVLEVRILASPLHLYFLGYFYLTTMIFLFF